ncbi:hypothetical protein A2U01_0049633, partial [Trifolium medium]|nr:hypothetical protein [Trifolium medium]
KHTTTFSSYGNAKKPLRNMKKPLPKDITTVFKPWHTEASPYVSAYFDYL